MWDDSDASNTIVNISSSDISWKIAREAEVKSGTKLTQENITSSSSKQYKISG